MEITKNDILADPDPLFDSDGAGKYLGGDKPLSGRTLENWRREGTGPTYIVLGAKCVRYRRSSLDAFLKAGERSSTSDNAVGRRGR